MTPTSTLRRLAQRFPRLTRPARRVYRRLRPIDLRPMYDESYFSGLEGRTAGISGYGNYERRLSNADVAAYLLWRFVPFRRSLDLGCAQGFVVEGLLDLGYDAHGTDISRFAIEQAGTHVRDRLSVVDLTHRRSRVKLRGERYDLITALEVLEHVEPRRVPSVLKFIRSIASGYVVATIPSLGSNPHGPDGFPNGKVRADVLDDYLALGGDYDGPVPFEDLRKAADGMPLEGHLCIASFAWWTRQFERAGFRRVGEMERAMHPVLGRFELSVAWNLYVFHVDDAAPPPALQRRERELAELERRWDLTKRPIGPHSQNITRDTVGEGAVTAIIEEYNASQQRPTLLEG